MKLRTKTRTSKTLFGEPNQAMTGKGCAQRRRSQLGFTLAEILAAMVFMAIVIPVAVQGIRLASLAGEVAQRKALATRVAERLLNEAVVTSQYSQAVRNGTTQEGALELRWTIRSELWKQDTMRQLSAEVTFLAQNQDYSVLLTTLVPQQ